MLPTTPVASPAALYDSQPSVPVSDRSATPRFVADGSAKTAVSPLTERLTSLAIADSEALPTPRPATRNNVCQAESSTPVDDSARVLQAAVAVLAHGGLCSPEQVAVLKNKYHSLKPLIAHLGPTFVGVSGLPLTPEEWHDVVKTWPLAIANVPEVLRVRDDSFYLQALYASEGSDEVIALLPPEHRERLYHLAFSVVGPELVERGRTDYATADNSEQVVVDITYVAMQSEETLFKWCMNDPDCFRYLIDQQRTERLSTHVCRMKGELLAEVPLCLRDVTMCKIACASNARAIASVPESVCTQAFCLWLVKTCPAALSEMAPDKITAQMCEYACSRDPILMYWVPGRLKTKSLCEKVLTHELAFLAYPFLP